MAFSAMYIIIYLLIVIPFFFPNIYLYSELQASVWSVPLNCLELNTGADEFAPIWNKYEGLLYYNSNSSGHSRYYTTRLLDSFKFTEPSELKGYLNKPTNNQSYITFITEDEAYLSTFKMYARGSKLNLFRTYKKKQVWSEPLIMETLQHDSFNSQPTVSPDGEILIFTSDRSSQYGDTDLWMSYHLEDGSWGVPVSLDEINSPGNEITPYLLSSDTLYFSTDGQEGKGGYDIYMSVRYGGIWQRPVPLDFINTEFDESDFMFLPGNYVMFSSNRPGGSGGLDLYISKYISDRIELSKSEFLRLEVQTLVSSINVKDYFNYFNLPVIPYIFIPTSGIISGHKLDFGKELNNLDVFKSVEDLYSSSPAIISNNLRKRGGANLDIILNSVKKFSINDSYELLSRGNFNGQSIELRSSSDIYDFFNKYSGNERDRINLITMQESDIMADEEFVILSSADSGIFETIKAGRDSIIIEPSLLEVFIDIKPIEDLKQWNCKLIISGKEIYISESGSYQGKIAIDLEVFKSLLWSADSLIVMLTAIDNSGKEYYKSINLMITHNKIETEIPIFINGRKYKQYLFFIVSENHLRLTSAFDFVFRQIEGSARKSVLVNYFGSRNSISKEAARGIIEELKKRLKKLNIQYFLDYRSEPYFIDIGDRFAKYIVCVLVEE